jgi:hypothetical protein
MKGLFCFIPLPSSKGHYAIFNPSNNGEQPTPVLSLHEQSSLWYCPVPSVVGHAPDGWELFDLVLLQILKQSSLHISHFSPSTQRLFVFLGLPITNTKNYLDEKSINCHSAFDSLQFHLRTRIYFTTVPNANILLRFLSSELR